MTDNERVESFTRGDEIFVDLGAIERELAVLWRQASADSGDDKAVTRACLWNLVFHAKGEDNFWRIKKLIDTISPRLPARVLVLRPEEKSEDKDERELEAWMSANCHIAPGGGKLLCSEEVTVTGRGNGQEHFPGVVRALLVPDVPVAFYWSGPPPTDLRLIRPLLHGVHRLLVDTGDIDSPEQLKHLAQLGAISNVTHLADLGWLRLSTYRFLIASLFDAPVGADPIVTAQRVTIGVTSTGAASAELLLGWMSYCLKWGKPRKLTKSTYRAWSVARMGGEVVLEIKEQKGEAGRDGVLSIEIESALGGRFLLKRLSGDYIQVKSPNFPPKAVPASTYKDEELLVASLGIRGNDPLFAEALKRAGEIERAGETEL